MPANVVVLFNPEDQIEDKIVSLIGKAREEILVNHYVLTSQRIAAALVKAHNDPKRKVLVTVLLEASPAVADYQTPAYLVRNGLPVLLVRGKGCNNNRYLVIDRQMVITGSYELTVAAAQRNDENVIIITDASVAAAYYNHWVARAANAFIPNTESP